MQPYLLIYSHTRPYTDIRPYTGGGTFISQQIWNKIFILHAILGIWIKIEKSSAGNRSMYIDISRWHTFCFGAVSSLTVIRWHRLCSRPRWCRSSRRFTWAFAPPVSLWMLCCAILARRTAIRLFFPNHRLVSFCRSCHLIMPRKHNTLHLFSQTSARGFLISCCVSSITARKNPSFDLSAIFKARRMSDCSSCTSPRCLAIVADMLKTYKKLVAASRVRIGCYLNCIRLRGFL